MPYDQNLAQVLMTLSALAYLGERPLPSEATDHHQQRIADLLTAELSNTGYATAGQWELAWGPALTVGNMMFIAQKAGTDDYALVIRGTDWSFLIDWVEDLDILQLVSFPYVRTSDPNVRIAKGTMEGLNALVGMTAAAPTLPALQPMSPLQFFNNRAMAAAGNINVYVTGHSLGGCLASVTGAWLQFQTAQWMHTGSTDVNVVIYTFAGPSAGNASFANYCAATFPDALFRVYNEYDVVPRGWQELHVPTQWYNPAPDCPLIVKGAAIGLQVTIAHDVYTQAGTPQSLPGTTNPSFAGNFWSQLGYQHDQNTYLGLLGAPQIDLSATTIVRAATGPNSFAAMIPKLNPPRV
jgi:hypothetical protein